MRRVYSIFLILLFGVGPLAEALPASEDARLPACCRRHGAHHCAMFLRYAAVKAEAASGKPFLAAPVTCPRFPGFTATPSPSIQALAAGPACLAVPMAQLHSLAAGRAAARQSQIRSRAGRVPPAAAIA